jgi:hypothetical protein
MGADCYICFYHDKRTYRSAKKAYREASRIKNVKTTGSNEPEVFHVFYCTRTGGYHLTSITQAEMDRRQAAHEGHGVHQHDKLKEDIRRLRRNPIFSPKRIMGDSQDGIPRKRGRAKTNRRNK